MKKYGFSFQGSKSKVAEKIIEIIPSSENFYDLFAGGCAITHCVLLSNKWKNIISNDIQNTPSLFMYVGNRLNKLQVNNKVKKIGEKWKIVKR